MDTTITIDKGTYDTLSQKAFKYDQIMAHYFSNASINTWDNDLHFDNSCLKEFIKIMEPIRYKNKLYELKKEEEKNAITSE